MATEKMCACGKPLHYRNEKIQRLVQQMVDDLGERVKVVAHGRAFLVPRHFLALHGLKAEEVADLGFEEVPV